VDWSSSPCTFSLLSTQGQPLTIDDTMLPGEALEFFAFSGQLMRTPTNRRPPLLVARILPAARILHIARRTSMMTQHKNGIRWRFDVIPRSKLKNFISVNVFVTITYQTGGLTVGALFCLLVCESRRCLWWHC
jgi:hypothetical protein